MSESAQELLKQVLSLPVDDRLEFIDEVIASCPDVAVDLGEAWQAEIQRRIDQIESGEAVLIPAEEVFRKLREACGVPERAP